MMVKPLAWDSAFFDLKIGELHATKEELFGSIDESFDLIYVKSTEEFALVLANYTSQYSETKVFFEKTGLNPSIPQNTLVKDCSRGNSNLDTLYDLAFESGKHSRFAQDPFFSEENFKKLYSAWIDNALNKTFADGFLVYEITGEIRGFVTYKIKNNKGLIGLIATNPKYQGKGIGSQLIASVENRLLTRGIDTLRIPTQLKNDQACKFYKKLGYSPVETTYLKHYWRDSL